VADEKKETIVKLENVLLYPWIEGGGGVCPACIIGKRIYAINQDHLVYTMMEDALHMDQSRMPNLAQMIISSL
jgi:hypothetical protein